MIKDYIFRLYIIAFSSIVLIGCLNAYVLTEIWDNYYPDFREASIYFEYGIFVILFYHLFKRLHFDFYFKIQRRLESVILLDVIFFPILILKYFSIMNSNGAWTSFNTLMTSVIFFVPTYRYFLGKKTFKTLIQIVLVLIVFLGTGKRFNALIFLLVLSIIHGKVNLKTLGIVMLIMFVVALSRQDDNSNSTLPILITSTLGSEIRDGLSIKRFFSDYEISSIRKDYLKNSFIASIPGYSKLGLMNGNTFREGLISYRYAEKLGFGGASEIKGIRVGIIKELELIFNRTGVVLFALLNAFLFIFYRNSKEDNVLKYYAAIFLIIPFYAIIGQADLVLSMPFNIVIVGFLINMTNKIYCFEKV